VRIVIPYINFHGRSFNDPVMIGGLEYFIKRVHDHYDDVKVVELTDYILDDIIRCKKPLRDRKLVKQLNNMVKDIALNYNADVIMSNWLFSIVSGAGMMDSPIPIIHIEHTNSAMMSSVNSLNRIKRNNHSVFLVNPYQKNYYDAYAKRLNCNIIDFDGYVEPAFLCGEKPKVQDNPEFDCVTIGRCDPLYKMPYRIKSMLKDTNFKTLLMTNPERHDERDEKCYKYWMENKHWDDCLYDLPHNEVMKNLSRGRTYFMTWADECFPIVGLEALSCGIPLILNSRMTDDRGPVKRQNFKYPLHGGDMWATDKSHYINIMHNSKEELIDAINKFKDIDRQEIQDMTWEKYTEKRWKSILDNAIDKTIENFKSNRGGVLSI
tara:strand:+ start:19 stop:1152 length:1134 start_codon:yes stop_codon:yes gene_type:complete